MVRKLPKIISRDEYEQLLKATGKDKELRAAIMLGFEAGMRISEIVGLNGRVPALTKKMVEGSTIRIEQGKGQKDRIVPRPKRFNEKAKAMLPLKIKRRTLQRKTTALAKKVLGKDMTFHTLRHGFVTYLIEQGRPLHEVQMLAGHSRLDTTGVYLHANPTKAIDAARDLF